MATYDLTSTTPTSFAAGDILNCPYSGSVKSVTLPKGTYKLEVWGASGGGTYGGHGGYSYGTWTISTSTTVYCVSGGVGIVKGSYSSSNTGGYNGGGALYSTNTGGSSGGGASHIATASGILSSISQSSVLCVAGGGGGGQADADCSGGHGGGEYGYAGNNTSTYLTTMTVTTSSYGPGCGGSQTQGGAHGLYTSTGYSYTNEGGSELATVGSYGQGGLGYGNGGSGGGGGWYGGGGGTAWGGGGGSGYINSNLSSSATLAGNNSFTSTSGGTETGHSGNGYCRITIVSVSNASLIEGTDGIPESIFYGDTAVDKIYYGDTLIWQQTPTYYTLTLSVSNSSYLGSYSVVGSKSGTHTSSGTIVKGESLTTSYSNKSNSSTTYGSAYPSSLSSPSLSVQSTSCIRVTNNNSYGVTCYYGTSSGSTSYSVWISSNSYYDVSGLNEGTTYYFFFRCDQYRDYSYTYYSTSFSPSSVDKVTGNVTITVTGSANTSSGSEYYSYVNSNSSSATTKSSWSTSLTWYPGGAYAVWASFTPYYSATYNFNVQRSSGSTDTGGSLWSSSSGGSCLTNNDDSSSYGSNQPGFSISLTANTTYYYQLSYYSDRTTWNPSSTAMDSGTYILYVSNSDGYSGSLSSYTYGSKLTAPTTYHDSDSACDIRVTNSNSVAVTCYWGTYSGSTANSLTISANDATWVTVPSWDTTYYFFFSASGYTNSSVASGTAGSDPNASSGGGSSSTTTHTLTIYRDLGYYVWYSVNESSTSDRVYVSSTSAYSVSVAEGATIYFGGCSSSSTSAATYVYGSVTMGSYDISIRIIGFGTYGIAFVHKGITAYGFDIDSSVSKPSGTNYVWKSNNQGVNSSYAVMKVCMYNYTSTSVSINSYAEKGYDYTILSDVDASTYPTSSTSTTMSTRYQTQATPTTSNWLTNTVSTGSGYHHFYVVFRKDSSSESGDDAGYCTQTYSH